MLRSMRRPAGYALLLVSVSTSLYSQDQPPRADAPQPEQPAAGEPAPSGAADEPALGQRQQQLQRDFERFEESLYKLSEVMRSADPDLADLLARARGQSREQRILQQMKALSDLLNQGNELGEAVGRQEEVIANLQTLLKLLQSEDERDRLAREIARYEDQLKDLNRIIGDQKDVRADTERRGDAGKLEGDQKRVTDKAQSLADKIDRQDAERAAEQRAAGSPGSQGQEQQRQEGSEQPQAGQPSDQKQGEPGSKEGEPGEKPEGEPKPGTDGEQEPKEGAAPREGSRSKEGSQSAEGSQSPSGSESQKGSPSQKGSQSQGGSQSPQGNQPQQESESEGSQSQQSGGDGQPSHEQNQTPGREDLERAIEEMNQAIEELRKKNHDSASDEQDAALAQLAKLKAKLEEILRQLREEERELFLAMLEVRFQNMLRLQLQINAETVRLDKVPADERESRHSSKATDLSRDQRDNALEADRALILLKEEGSSVAFPEAVEQMRDNMITVAGRLENADTGETTQLIEQIIVETLDEMILSLQREMEKLKQQQQQQQQQEQQEQDPPLVDVLAELKMIRSLQNQVNRLTRQVGLDVQGEQAADAQTLQLLNDLALRQQRIQEATYDLSTGKTSLGQQLRQGDR